MEEKQTNNNENYTEEMATEDRKLVLFWASKWVRLHPFLENNKNDLISYLYYNVVKLRQNYNPEIGVKYGTYILQSFKFLCMSYVHNYIKDQNNNNKSLDAEIDGTDDFSLMDTISIDCDFDANTNYAQLLKYIKQATATFKPKQAKILEDYTKNPNIAIVAKQNDCTRQYVDLLVKKFRIYLKEILLQNEFVSEKFFTKELTDKYTYRKTINLSEYARKFNIHPSVSQRLYKKYCAEQQTISFEQYIADWKKKRDKTKNMSKYEKYKYYTRNRRTKENG